MASSRCSWRVRAACDQRVVVVDSSKAVRFNNNDEDVEEHVRIGNVYIRGVRPDKGHTNKKE